LRVNRLRGALATAVLLFLAAIGFAASAQAYNFLYDTPAGRSWTQMDNDIQRLKNQIPADGGPRTSAEGARRVALMRDMARRYRDGITLFQNARPVTNIRAEEQRWYDYMQRSCGIHSQEWDQNADTIQRITDGLRRVGK
jgi:hypothetical protein